MPRQWNGMKKQQIWVIQLQWVISEVCITMDTVWNKTMKRQWNGLKKQQIWIMHGQ